MHLMNCCQVQALAESCLAEPAGLRPSLQSQFVRITHSLSLTHSLAHSLTRSLTHSLTHSLTRSLTHSLAHSLTHSLQVSSNQRGVNASQVKLGGTGLGSFNDRFRDALMGGSPFASPLFQGWLTGTVSLGVSVLTSCQYNSCMLCTMIFPFELRFPYKH